MAIHAPNLECRMYESLYPNENDVVMVQVQSVIDGRASVSLLEYNNLPGRIKKISSCEIGLIQPGLIEPRRVLRVKEHPRPVSRSKKRVKFDDKHACIQKYNKSKHVHTVLRYVASTVGLDLLELYRATRWPIYDVLMDDQAEYWRSCNLAPGLVEALMDAFKRITLRSWRIYDPRKLASCSVKQTLQICWAFALVRQAEAAMKSEKIIEDHEYLSVQDLVNKSYYWGLLNKHGSLYDLADVRDVVCTLGLVKELDCPLTQVLEKFAHGSYAPQARTYNILEMRVVRDNEYTSTMWRGKLRERLMEGPLTVSVFWYESYQKNINGIGIYRLTFEELLNGKTKDTFVHNMLLTGEGVDKDDDGFHPYWEMQDCNGDINNGDCGYLKFAQQVSVFYYGQWIKDVELIFEYVEIELSVT